MQFYSEQVSTTFIWGGFVTLTSSWHDKNVILSHSKLFYLTEGEISIEIDGKNITAKAGDLVLIPSGKKHSYCLTEKQHAKKFWLHFDMSVADTSYFDIYSPPYKISVGEDKKIEKNFRLILSSARKNTPADKLMTASSIFSLVSYYLEHSILTEKTVKNDEIDVAIEQIKNNFSKKFTLYELAKIANLSPSYFLKKFKQRTGYAPIKYASILKMERAKFLIEQSDTPISLIMEELGFFDASHFSKLFKKYSGYSPLSFRKISKERFDDK